MQKIRFGFLGAVFLSLPLSGGVAWCDEEPVPQEHFEAAISRIFVPTVGYDDNDSVQFVIEGQLANGCMMLDESQVTREAGSTEIRVKQLSVRRSAGACKGQDEELPPHLRQPVSFSQVVSAGRLDGGRYRISGGGAERFFRVDPAASDATDNFAYAPVSGVMVPSQVKFGKPTDIILSGEAPTGCLELLEPEIRVIEDVVIVLPKTRVVENVPCGPAESFVQTARVEQLRKGRYLAHIRSAGGVSTNQLFTVK